MAHKKTTSRRVAKKASRSTKSIAGSALSQKHGKGRRRGK